MQSCICVHNFDITTGCAAGFNPSTQAFERNSPYRCTYCYALRYNYMSYKPKVINWLTLEKELIALNVKILRTGKATDPGYIQDRENLKLLLRLAKKLNFKVIVITKLLEAGDDELAQLIIDSNSTLHISLGDDAKELGPVALGFDNKQRLLVGSYYHNLGVNTCYRVITDPTRELSDIDKQAVASNVPILLTPIRYYDKKAAESYNEDWEDLKTTNRYKHVHGSLHVNVDKFLDIWKDEKIRHCGIAVDSFGKELEGCSGCQLFKPNKDWDYNIRLRG